MKFPPSKITAERASESPQSPLNELLKKAEGAVPQALFVFCDRVVFVGVFLFQLLELFQLLTHLLQTLRNYGEPGKGRDAGPPSEAASKPPARRELWKPASGFPGEHLPLSTRPLSAQRTRFTSPLESIMWGEEINRFQPRPAEVGPAGDL